MVGVRKIIFLIVLLIGAHISKAQPPLNTRFIPTMDLHDLNDNVVKTDVLNNHFEPFIVVFWAVWCKPCLLELNTIHENYDEWVKKYDIKIFAVSVDEPERLERAKGYAAAKDWHYEVYFDEHGILEKAMHINGVPHMILFNGSREIFWQTHDYHSGDEEELLRHIKEVKGIK